MSTDDYHGPDVRHVPTKTEPIPMSPATTPEAGKGDDEITITDEQAESAVMQWEVLGRLPPLWTKGTLSTAYLILAARENRREEEREQEMPRYLSDERETEPQ